MKVKYVTIQHFVKDDVTPPVTIDSERVFFVEIPYKLNEEETKKFVDIVQQHNPFIYYRKVPSETTTTVLDEPTDKIAVTGKIRPKEQEYILEGVFYALAEIRRERDSWFLRVQRKLLNMLDSVFNRSSSWFASKIENLKKHADNLYDLDDQIKKALEHRDYLLKLERHEKAEREMKKRIEEMEKRIKYLEKQVAEGNEKYDKMLKMLADTRKMIIRSRRQGEDYYDGR